MSGSGTLLASNPRRTRASGSRVRLLDMKSACRSSVTPTCRMLPTMRSLTQAARALCYYTAVLPRSRGARRRRHRRGRLAGARRSAHADCQGVVHGDRAGGHVARNPGAWRHGLHRGNRCGAAVLATRASPRSTRAPTGSRRSTSWDGSSCSDGGATCRAMVSEMRSVDPMLANAGDAARRSATGAVARAGRDRTVLDSPAERRQARPDLPAAAARCIT